MIHTKRTGKDVAKNIFNRGKTMNKIPQLETWRDELRAQDRHPVAMSRSSLCHNMKTRCGNRELFVHICSRSGSNRLQP